MTFFFLEVGHKVDIGGSSFAMNEFESIARFVFDIEIRCNVLIAEPLKDRCVFDFS